MFAMLHPHFCHAQVTRSEAADLLKRYYSLLQLYAWDPSQVGLQDKIAAMFSDGQGSVVNDVYSEVYGNPSTNTDIRNFVTTIGAYKNRTGYALNIHIDEDSFRFKEKDSASMYVTLSKRVYCNLGRLPVDYSVSECVLVRNNKIVCISKEEPRVENHVGSSLVINDIEFANCDSTWNVLDNFGAMLYASSIRYLDMKISYTSTMSSTVFLKVVDPQGLMMQGKSSPAGCTASITLAPSVSVASRQIAWGHETEVCYVPGTYVVEIWDGERTLYSESIYLHPLPKGCTIDRVDARLDEKDLVLECDFTISGMKGQNACVSCYFYDNEGRALHSYDSRWCTPAGNVASSTSICPSYDNARYTDLVISIPKAELHLAAGRSHKMKVMVVVWDMSLSRPVEIFRSRYMEYTYVS